MTLSVTVIIASFILLFCGSTVVYGDDDSQYYEVKSSDPKEGVFTTTPIFQNGAAKLLKCGVDQVLDKVEKVDFKMNGKRILNRLTNFVGNEEVKFIETRCKGLKECFINLPKLKSEVKHVKLRDENVGMIVKYKCRQLPIAEIKSNDETKEPQIGYWKSTEQSNMNLECDSEYVFHQVQSVEFGTGVVSSRYGKRKLAVIGAPNQVVCSGRNEAKYIDELCQGIHSCKIDKSTLTQISHCKRNVKKLSFYYQCRLRTASDPAVTVTSNEVTSTIVPSLWKFCKGNQAFLSLKCPRGKIFDAVNFASFGNPTIPGNIITPAYAKTWKYPFPVPSEQCHGVKEIDFIRKQCKNSDQCKIDVQKLRSDSGVGMCFDHVTFLAVEYVCKKQEMNSAINQ